MPHPDMDPIGVVDQREKPQHLLKIIQRLSNSHHNNVGNRFSTVQLREQHLIQDLRGFQIPDLPASGRSAEHATHIAPHLAGYTDSIPMLITHQNRLNAISIFQPPQVLDRSV